MSLRNANWYNLQSTRNYPLADDATATADNGARLPGFVLADCHLRWPDTLGQYAFLGGLTITPTLVTAVIMAADDPDAVTGFIPLAAVSLLQPVDENRPYVLQALAEGAGGFIAFGSVGDACALRFSTPRQGLLSPKCARPEASLPISSLRKLGSPDALRDLVRIVPGADMTITEEEVYLPEEGITVTALVFRLNQSLSTRNVLSAYLGPCSQRPESGTCDTVGIESINGVTADCDGNLTISLVGTDYGVLAGCGSEYAGGEDAGLVVESVVGIEDVCDSKVGATIGSDDCPPRELVGSEAPECVVDCDEALWEGTGAPFPADEYWGDETDTAWTVKKGSFVFEDDGFGLPSAYTAHDCARTNISLYNCHPLPGGTGTMYKLCTLGLTLCDTCDAQNGGIVVDWHVVNTVVDGVSSCYVEYWLVLLNRAAGALQVWHRVGPCIRYVCGLWLGEIELHASYLLTAETAYDPDNVPVIIAGVTGGVTGSLRCRATYPGTLGSDGYFGVGSLRAAAHFFHFTLDSTEIPTP